MKLITFSLLYIFSNFCLGESRSFNDPLAPALYVFGDSLVDSGNNNYLSTFARANYRPYGIDFPPGNNPTGRVTNGQNVADFIATSLNLPLVPTRLPWQPRSRTGYNYASASCGILNETRLGNCLNLTQQVAYFETTVDEELTSYFPNPTELSQHLSKSIFLVCIGSNDYLITYFNKSNDLSKLTPEEFAELVIERYAQNLHRLYSLGARKLLLTEVGALGCIPYSRRQLPPGETGCDDWKNQAAKIFNDKLANLVENLQSVLQDSHFTLARTYELSYDVFVNPTDYGISNTTHPCCLAGPRGPCVIWSRPCPAPRRYYFWDAFHPSTAFYNIVADKCLSNSTFCHPYNVMQLVEAGTDVPQTSLHSAA